MREGMAVRVWYLASFRLAHHTLTDFPRLERVIETKAANVRVGTDSLDPRKVANFLGSEIYVLGRLRR